MRLELIIKGEVHPGSHTECVDGEQNVGGRVAEREALIFQSNSAVVFMPAGHVLHLGVKRVPPVSLCHSRHDTYNKKTTRRPEKFPLVRPLIVPNVIVLKNDR